MFTARKTEVFERWFLGLKDRLAARRIQARIDRGDKRLQHGYWIGAQPAKSESRIADGKSKTQDHHLGLR